MPRKPRFVKQRDAMQCGVASLAMICSCFGKQYSVDRLEAFCTPTREGVSMKLDENEFRRSWCPQGDT